MYSAKTLANRIHIAAMTPGGDVTLSSDEARLVSDLIKLTGSHIEGGATFQRVIQALAEIERPIAD